MTSRNRPLAPSVAQTHTLRVRSLVLLLLAFGCAVSTASGARAGGPGLPGPVPLMTSDLPPVSGQSVIGSDERIQITDTTEFPFSAIAYLELEDGAEQPLGSCTATFIGPDALLTAAHCLWDFEAGDWVESSVRVVPGKNGDTEPFGSEIAADWWVPDAYTETGATVWDWGLIKLPDAALSAETGWLTMAVLDTAVLAGRDFEPTIIGYPADKPTATMWGLIRPAFLAVTDFTLVYDIDTAPGQSGSAIWSAAEGPNLGKIVGIHTRGGAVNSGSRIDQELLDDVLEGCALMGCTIAMDSTPASPPPGPELAFKSYSVAIARD